MKHLTLAAVVVAAFACAPFATAQTQAQQIIGRWTCMANTPDGLISGQMNYSANGTAHSTLIMAIAGTADGEVIMDVTSKWRAPGDGTLREEVTKLDIVRFMMGGKVINDPSMADSAKEMMQGELQSGSLQITATSLTMIDSENVRTNCVR